ncbi:MAG: DUF3560 domain-containing protein, partial [Mycobacteriaceae bacterium]|nr:DUF3560 domain-containing protein [Mycobacteriaceae bacterium]
WYLPHSRRRRADTYKIDTAVTRLRELGHEVDVEIDDTTPAVDFAAFIDEKYDRADDRAAYQQYMARRDMWTSDSIRESNQRTYDMLNGQPILIGHHSEHRHRRLLERLWQREGKAWALYDTAKHRIDRAWTAANFRTYKENPGTTQRRILTIETVLRRIGRELEKDGDKCSDHYLATTRAEIVEKLEEIDYWWNVLDDAGVHVWGPDDFEVGDFVAAYRDRWHEVVRVNAKSVSVAGRFGGVSARIVTHAGSTRRNCPPQPLPYHEVIGRLTATQAREQFPEVFAELDAAPARPRPAKKRGSVKLAHHPAAEGECWQWRLGDAEYRAFWRHPQDWWRGDHEPVIEPGVIHVSAYRAGNTPTYVSRGEPVDVVVAEIPIDGDVAWVEEVHNQLRDHVQTHYAAASAP